MKGLELIGLEIAVIAAGIAILLLDLWTAKEDKRRLGYAAALLVGVIFLASFAMLFEGRQEAFHGMYVLDEFALFFKRFFLIAALLVLLISVEFADRFESGVAEYYAITLFALAGMMFAASANDFTLLFVSIELVAVCFYVLVSFQRQRDRSLEAGVKYLITGALSGGFLVYGIALIYGTAGTLNFRELASLGPEVLESRLLLLGLLFVFVGLGFKIAVVPFQIWVPDVYQGAPVPTTAFLAAGSKGAGVVLLARLLYTGLRPIADRWGPVLVMLAMLTILYGGLCAIPQRNFRRLMGYSSIVNAGFILLALAAGTADGLAATLFYLAAYLYGVMGAFVVLCLARCPGQEDETCVLAGLHHRSPLLAATLTLAMVSLAGIPPAAGFFGKFQVFKAVIGQGAAFPYPAWALGVAVFGAVVSLYFYLSVVRTVFWSSTSESVAPIRISHATRWAVYLVIFAILWLGILPGAILNLAEYAVHSMGL